MGELFWQLGSDDERGVRADELAPGLEAIEKGEERKR